MLSKRCLLIYPHVYFLAEDSVTSERQICRLNVSTREMTVLLSGTNLFEVDAGSHDPEFSMFRDYCAYVVDPDTLVFLVGSVGWIYSIADNTLTHKSLLIRRRREYGYDVMDNLKIFHYENDTYLGHYLHNSFHFSNIRTGQSYDRWCQFPEFGMSAQHVYAVLPCIDQILVVISDGMVVQSRFVVLCCNVDTFWGCCVCCHGRDGY